MVRLYVSLLALALATKSALAFSDEYERNLYKREFVDSLKTPFTREDHEDLHSREVQVFDDLEEREPLGLLFLTRIGVKLGVKLGAKLLAKKVGHHVVKHAAGRIVNGRLQSRASGHDEELFGRDLGAEGLFEREYD